MSQYDERFLAKDNFYFAFKKLSHHLRQNNEWYDPVALAAYEGNLAGNIYRLKQTLEAKVYAPQPLEPLPFPKKNDKEGSARMRQYFSVSIDDQLVWIALINVIGQKLEDKMPFWSYGNRLHRPVWYEANNNTGKMEKRIGSFHNGSAQFYRKWNQSWPLYRRYISMTVKVMGYNGRFKKEDLDEDREVAILEEEEAAGLYENLYLDGKFWPEGQLDNLYWAGLDLKRFFPSVRVNKIIENIEAALVQDNDLPRTDVSLIMHTVRQMLSFPVNPKGWRRDDLQSETLFGLKDISNFTGLPTGLFAAGFLANVAMIDVDRKVNDWIKKNRSVAVFKYVDDHILLARSFEALQKFIDFYHDTINESATGVTFQADKVEPSDVLEYSTEGGFKWKQGAERDTRLDIQFPEPLMTYTVQKMSDLNDEDYELAEDGDLEKMQSDLEHFLIAEFPDTEMRRDTRMSFAAMKLCQLAKQKKPDFAKMDRTSEALIRLVKKRYFAEPANRNKGGKIELKILNRLLDQHINNVYHAEMDAIRKGHERTYHLLIKVARDYPDKLKLWKRAIEFCHISGINKWDKIVEEVDNCKLHPASKEYVFAYVLLVTQEYLLRSCQTIASPTSSFMARNSAILFIRHIYVGSVERKIRRHLKAGRSYPFLQMAIEYYAVVFDFVMQQKGALANEIIYIRLKDSVVYRRRDFWMGQKWKVEDEPFDLLMGKEEYVWYLLLKLPGSRKDIWTHNAEILDLKRPLTWSILSLYPGNVSKKLFQRMRKNISSNSDIALNLSERSNFSGDSAFVYEFLVSNREFAEKVISNYPVIKKALSPPRHGYIRLKEWFETLLYSSADNSRLDPRLSEWSQLEIVKQIAQAIHEGNRFGKQSIFSVFAPYHFHPANYLVPQSWSVGQGEKLVSWKTWKEIVDKDRIRLAPKNSFINDFRYFPIAGSWKMNSISVLGGNADVELIMGLSVLLLQMIARSFEWPPTANKSEFIDQFLSTALHTLEVGGTSSDTRILLGAIFSKKDFDMFNYVDAIKLGKDKQIRKLSDFVDVIESVQKGLARHHIGLKDRDPRQLIYIDLDDLSAGSLNSQQL